MIKKGKKKRKRKGKKGEKKKGRGGDGGTEEVTSSTPDGKYFWLAFCLLTRTLPVESLQKCKE
jgi:hypothetical protein